MSENVVVVIAVVILVVLFSIQHLGIDRVSWIFAPIVFIWLFLIGGVGIFNIWKYDSSVLRAFSPVYVYRFFKKGDGWTWPSLGGIMICIRVTEALFADLSQFSVLAIQIVFAAVVFPCLLLGYIGQAAYLMQNTDKVYDAFYHSIPESIYWPVVVVATAAAIVASQATIYETFYYHIYIPEINWILMVLCIAIAAGFKNQYQIKNLSGITVIMVMLLTTFLMVLVMLIVWCCHWILVLIFTILSLIVEGTYFSSLVLKVNRGGCVPLAIAVLHSKVSIAWILGLGHSMVLVRVPGVGLAYTELPSGIPHIFSHFITNNLLPAIHYVVIFVCIKYLPVYTVPEGERYLLRRIRPNNFYMFHGVARYCYKYQHKKDDDFEKKFFENLFKFVRMESLMDGGSDLEVYSLCYNQSEHYDEDALVSCQTQSHTMIRPCHRFVMMLGWCIYLGIKWWWQGGVHLYTKKLELITFILFLGSYVEKIPHECLLNVGQVIFE
ncbi:hypothetical protein ACOSQ3_013474 [Xanthoceras sorbifolium]